MSTMLLVSGSTQVEVAPRVDQASAQWITGEDRCCGGWLSLSSVLLVVFLLGTLRLQLGITSGNPICVKHTVINEQPVIATPGEKV